VTAETITIAGPSVGVPTALYRYFDEADLTLYIGISDHLPVREQSHVKASVWMQFAVRSTISRHPTRIAALDAERRAIETEHPIFNKQYNNTREAVERCKRYLAEHGVPDLRKINDLEVSIPIQEFRGEPPARQPPTSRGRDAGAEHRTRYRYGGIPEDWPRTLWCNVWQNADRFWPFADEMRLRCCEGTRLTSTRYHLEVRKMHAEGSQAWAAEAWVEPDNPKAFSKAQRYAATWSAHCEIRPAPQATRMHPVHEDLQRQFLYELLRKRRCSAIRLGSHAQASGFFWKEEAQVAGAILSGMAWADIPRAVDQRLAVAIVRAAPVTEVAHECPQCKVRFMDYEDRRPLCLECRLEMTALYDDYGWPITSDSPFG
jgi:hypothetical protein